MFSVASSTSYGPKTDTSRMSKEAEKRVAAAPPPKEQDVDFLELIGSKDSQSIKWSDVELQILNLYDQLQNLELEISLVEGHKSSMCYWTSKDYYADNEKMLCRLISTAFLMKSLKLA
jgi:hypothetical protein